MIRSGFIVLSFAATTALSLSGCSTPNTASTGIVASNKTEAKISKAGFLREAGRLKHLTPGEKIVDAPGPRALRVKFA